MSLVQPQLRRTVLQCKRPVLVRCAASPFSQPPVSNPIIRLAAAAANMLTAAKQRLQQAVAETVRQTNEEVSWMSWMCLQRRGLTEVFGVSLVTLFGMLLASCVPSCQGSTG